MTDTWEYGDDASEPTVGPMSEPWPRFPWPPAEGESVLARFGETWRSATVDPARFFARVPRDAGTGAAVLYYLAIVMIVAGATLFWDSLAIVSGARAELAGDLGVEPLDPIVGFLLTPAILLGMLFVAAAVTHMVLSLFDGVRHGFGTTVRVFAYAYSPGVFGVIPVIGGLVGTIWMLVLLVIGLREAHGTDGWKAALAVLLPFLVLFGLMVLAFLMVMAAGAALLGQAGG